MSNQSVETIREYDANGNLTHFRDSNGYERWWEYDANGNLTHFRNSDGFEEWWEYDANGNQTHFRNSDGFEEWREYDANGQVIDKPPIFKPMSNQSVETIREYDARDFTPQPTHP